MRIQWVRYIGGKGAAYLLILNLGNRNGKVCLLKCRSVRDDEIAKLRAAMKELAAVSLDRRLGWVKAYCPDAWRNAYREVPETAVTVVKEY